MSFSKFGSISKSGDAGVTADELEYAITENNKRIKLQSFGTDESSTGFNLTALNPTEGPEMTLRSLKPGLGIEMSAQGSHLQLSASGLSNVYTKGEVDTKIYALNESVLATQQMTKEEVDLKVADLKTVDTSLSGRLTELENAPQVSEFSYGTYPFTLYHIDANLGQTVQLGHGVEGESNPSGPPYPTSGQIQIIHNGFQVQLTVSQIIPFAVEAPNSDPEVGEGLSIESTEQRNRYLAIPLDFLPGTTLPRPPVGTFALGQVAWGYVDELKHDHYISPAAMETTETQNHRHYVGNGTTNISDAFLRRVRTLSCRVFLQNCTINGNGTLCLVIRAPHVGPNYPSEPSTILYLRALRYISPFTVTWVAVGSPQGQVLPESGIAAIGALEIGYNQLTVDYNNLSLTNTQLFEHPTRLVSLVPPESKVPNFKIRQLETAEESGIIFGYNYDGKSATISVDPALIGKINAEIQARIQGDATLTTAITAETNARLLADENLTGAIDTEVQARIQGDAALAAAIANETTARIQADGDLEFALTSAISLSVESHRAEYFPTPITVNFVVSRNTPEGPPGPIFVPVQFVKIGNIVTVTISPFNAVIEGKNTSGVTLTGVNFPLAEYSPSSSTQYHRVPINITYSTNDQYYRAGALSYRVFAGQFIFDINMYGMTAGFATFPSGSVYIQEWFTFSYSTDAALPA